MSASQKEMTNRAASSQTSQVIRFDSSRWGVQIPETRFNAHLWVRQSRINHVISIPHRVKSKRKRRNLSLINHIGDVYDEKCLRSSPVPFCYYTLLGLFVFLWLYSREESSSCVLYALHSITQRARIYQPLEELVFYIHFYIAASYTVTKL